MTEIDVPDWVVEAAEDARVHRLNAVTAYGSAGVDERYHMAMRAALTAALGAWVVPVGKVCMNGRRYGHGLFADIEVQYPTTTTPGPKIGSDLYTLRQEKPE